MGHTPCTISCGRRFAPAVLLILCLACIALSVDAASTRGLPTTTTSPFQLPPTIELATPAPQTVTCQAPCSCMERSRATAAWGADGFTQCNEKACGYSYTAAGLPIEKYCLKQKTITTSPLVRFVPPTTTVTYPHVVTIPMVTTTTKGPVQLVTLNPSGICPGDSDCDGRLDESDNCPAVPNTQQLDSDSSILWSTCTGTLCKLPAASDLMNCEGSPGTPLYENCMKNAWAKANPGGSCLSSLNCQHSTDNFGDACDNCWEVQNPDQADTDQDCASFKKDPAFWDGKQWLKDPQCGDACDRCPGHDDHIDSDKDGVPDGCDKCPGFDDTKDADKDGVPDGCDNCWNTKNAGQADSDGDCAMVKQNATFWDGSKWLQDPHCGDACDNCPNNANPEQLDSNNDGKGDACSCPWCTDTKIRPVYISGPAENKIDIVLIPSSTGWDMEHSIAQQRDDYNKTESVFRAVVFDNIQNGYFRLDSYSTSPVPADFRTRFNFYYYWDPASPADAHSSCGGTLPAGFTTSVPFRDAAIILYPKVVTSTGSFPIGGCSAGLVTPAQITAPGFWPPTLLHESGHGVFGLVDTYCSRPGIDTSYSQNDPNSNVWTSESNCKQAPASPYGNLNPANCRRIEADDPATPKNPDCSIDFWRYDPDPDDMRDCDFTSRFGTASVRRIDYVFESFS